MVRRWLSEDIWKKLSIILTILIIFAEKMKVWRRNGEYISDRPRK